jgi:hypothetical protein
MSRALNDVVKTIKNECKKLCAAYHPNKESSPERKAWMEKASQTVYGLG